MPTHPKDIITFIKTSIDHDRLFIDAKASYPSGTTKKTNDAL